MKKIWLGLILIVLASVVYLSFKIGFYFTNNLLLNSIIISIEIFCTLFTAYTSIIGYLGLRKHNKTKVVKPEKSFAVIVAAHNEEKVVADIVDNLNNLDYPKSLYDVYVICDNCADRTADIVREHGGIAMERFDTSKKGKGYALEWMFDHLWKIEEDGKAYDAIVMFDADNLVAENFLSIANTKLLEGHDVIQGYLDSKNPNDTWITKSYAYSYWATNRVFQLSREHLGLSAQLGGTGVIVASHILKTMGWGATSLTEDLEFTQRYILKTGKRVVWAHDAKVFDEKPLEFKASWKQRIRWMQGHADCMMRYSPKMLKAFIKKPKLIYLDSLIYLLQPSKIIINLVLMILSLYSLTHVIFNNSSIFSGPLSLIFFTTLFLIFNVLPLIGIFLETSYKVVLWTPFVYLFSLSWLPITLLGFLKRNQKVWSHTEHTRSVLENTRNK